MFLEGSKILLNCILLESNPPAGVITKTTYKVDRRCAISKRYC